MSSIIKEGNLLDSTEDAIVHQCNCFNTMGAGVAWAIAQKWPEAQSADNFTKRGDKTKFGDFSYACINNQKQFIINLYSQFHYGGGRCYTNYQKMEYGLYKLKTWISQLLEDQDILSLAFPYLIGCGLAGGEWSIVKPLIENVFKEPNFKIIFYKLPDIEYHPFDSSNFSTQYIETLDSTDNNCDDTRTYTTSIPYCEKCGRPFFYSNDSSNASLCCCNEKDLSKELPEPIKKASAVGWICPKCDNVINPNEAACPFCMCIKSTFWTTKNNLKE